MVTSQAIQWVEKHYMITKRLIAANALFLLFIHTPIQADVYKWVDENGQVHYGEKPGNSAAESITIRKNETTTPRTIKTPEDDKKEGGEGEATKEDGTQATPTAEAPLVPEKVPKKEKRKLCNEAKSDLAAINSRGRMREINEKGEYVYLDDSQRQKRIAAAKKKQAEFCR